MKIDTTLLVSNLSEMPALTRAAEEMGFDGIWTADTAHDALLPLTLAAEHSQRLSLGTSIAVAFPCSSDLTSCPLNRRNITAHTGPSFGP